MKREREGESPRAECRGHVYLKNGGICSPILQTGTPSAGSLTSVQLEGRLASEIIPSTDITCLRANSGMTFQVSNHWLSPGNYWVNGLFKSVLKKKKITSLLPVRAATESIFAATAAKCQSGNYSWAQAHWEISQAECNIAMGPEQGAVGINPAGVREWLRPSLWPQELWALSKEVDPTQSHISYREIQRF